MIFKYQLTFVMNFKKTILLISILFPLNACVQSTAFMGPGVTIATSGNIAQAGFQYGTNKIIEKQTGKNTLSLIVENLSPTMSKWVEPPAVISNSSRLE